MSIDAPVSRPISLSFQEYQARAIATDRTRKGSGDLVFPLLGLFGETGSLLSEAKKKHRDAAFYLGYEQSVVEELGDVLWYLAILADRANIQLSDLAHSVSRDYRSWDQDRDPQITINSLGHAVGDGIRSAPTPSYD